MGLFRKDASFRVTRHRKFVSAMAQTKSDSLMDYILNPKPSKAELRAWGYVAAREYYARRRTA